MDSRRNHGTALRNFLFLLVIAFSLLSFQQPRAQTNLQGGINFVLGFPQGEFDDNVDENGFGVAGEVLYSPSTSLFGFGLSGGFLRYGGESRREPFSTTIPDVEVEVITTNNIVLLHLLFRVQSKGGPIRPYLDGLLGLNYLFTETRIEDLGDNEDVASSTNLDDGVFSYGGGGGIMVKLYEGEGEQFKIWSVLLDLRVRYLAGGEAEYLKKGSIRREGGKVRYDVIESKTDILTGQIGVTVDF